MNYLAHLYLSHDNSELIIGSILGDFVKGSIHQLYTPEIRKGIQLHRQIDSYTDAHQIVHFSKQTVTASRRRFAGIMVDLFYDHFLAQHWSSYSSVSLYVFSQQVYTVLLESREILPAALDRILPYMIEEDWLTSYQEISHIGKALNGISRRLKRQNTLLDSVEELEKNYAAFESYFQTFFPDVVAFVNQRKQMLETP